MLSDTFCCPICKGTLSRTSTEFGCKLCLQRFKVVDDIPDFFISESEQDSIPINDRNRIWLHPEVVEARNTKYHLRYARQLKGMAFCMEQLSQRTFSGCRVLEVGMGTGHFTRWLAEMSKPGTEIYAFDFSWYMIEKAKVNTHGLSDIIFFRANARGALPFRDGIFDIVFLRLAPLGPRDVPAIQASFELLKPGGWFFEAGWEKGVETPPTEWAIQHGYEYAEHHVWQYKRIQSEEEYLAGLIEELMLVEGKSLEEAKTIMSNVNLPQERSRGIPKMIHESLLIAQKPED